MTVHLNIAVVDIVYTLPIKEIYSTYFRLTPFVREYNNRILGRGVENFISVCTNFSKEYCRRSLSALNMLGVLNIH